MTCDMKFSKKDVKQSIIFLYIHDIIFSEHPAIKKNKFEEKELL